MRVLKVLHLAVNPTDYAATLQVVRLCFVTWRSGVVWCYVIYSLHSQVVLLILIIIFSKWRVLVNNGSALMVKACFCICIIALLFNHMSSLVLLLNNFIDKHLALLVFQSEKETRTFAIKPIPNANVKPVIVFINPKSGGNQGAKLMQKFQWLLNPRQVFDLTQGGPKAGLVSPIRDRLRLVFYVRVNHDMTIYKWYNDMHHSYSKMYYVHI